MFRNPFFTAVLGLMVGLVFGYVLAEKQGVPPAASMRAGGVEAPQQAMGRAQPEAAEEQAPEETRNIEDEAGRLRDLLAESPDDPLLMTALGNLYFDASRWEEARNWYERVLELKSGDINVETDLAVVYRNIKQPEKAMKLLQKVVKADPAHWQGWYNLVVVLHFDLHQHEEALKALKKLEELASGDSSIPDLSGFIAQVSS